MKKPTDFICKMKFFNTLPDPPCDPKLLDLSAPLERFGDFQPFSLQADYKHELVLGADMGLNIDLVDPSFYTLPAKPGPLAPEDAALLEAERETLARQSSGSKRKAPLSVPWLRKSEFITSVFDENLYNQSQQKEDVTDLPVGDADPKQRILEAQLKWVDRSFGSTRTPVHPFNKQLKAVSVTPLLPNRRYVGNNLYHVVVDELPTVLEDAEAERLESKYLFQNVTDPDGGENMLAMLRLVSAKRRAVAPEPEKPEGDDVDLLFAADAEDEAAAASAPAPAEEWGDDHYVMTDAYQPNVFRGKHMEGKYVIVVENGTTSYLPLELRCEMQALAKFYRGAPPALPRRFIIPERLPTEVDEAKWEEKYNSTFGRVEYEDNVVDEEEVADGDNNDEASQPMDMDDEEAQDFDLNEAIEEKDNQ